MGVGLELCLEVATLHEVEELGGVDGAICEVVEGFLGGGWVFLLDEGAKGAAFAEVPCFLGIGEGDAEFLFEGGEVFLLVGGGFRFPAWEFVLGVIEPGEEVELGIKRSEGFADAGHGFFHHLVIGAGFATFVGGLEEDEAFDADGFLTAGADFAGSLRELLGYGAELGDVEELEGATTEGGADVDVGAVEEGGFLGFNFGALGGVFNFGTDFCESVVERGRVGRQEVQMLEGEFDFFEFGFGIWQGAVYDAGFEVVVEEA